MNTEATLASPVDEIEGIDIPPTPGNSEAAPETESSSRWDNAKAILTDERIGTQVAETAAGTIASIAGIKSFYDVPKYLHQRFMVRGVDLGRFGKAKGLEGSIEGVIGASQEMRAGFQAESAETAEGEGDASTPHSVRDAIKDLNDRLALTKEGDVKGSEQRKMVAKLLAENRTRERMSADERSEKITEILDDYTTTKVTGMQAIRESLNTALVASGALSLRGVSYGLLDGVERYQRLEKEAKKNGGGVDIVKDVIVGSVTETMNDALLRNAEEKGTVRTAMDSVKAWGKILRFVGIGSTVSLRPESMVDDADRVLETFSGKLSADTAADHFQGNIEATIAGYERVWKGTKNLTEHLNPLHSENAEAGDLILNPRAKLSLAERAAMASGDLDKGSHAIDTLNNPKIPFAEKMAELQGFVRKGESVDMNGLIVKNDGGRIFVNGKALTESGLDGILKAQSDGTAHFYEQAKKGGIHTTEAPAVGEPKHTTDKVPEIPASHHPEKPDGTPELIPTHDSSAHGMDTLRNAFPQGEDMAVINGKSFGRIGNDLFFIDNASGKVIPITEANIATYLPPEAQVHESGPNRSTFMNRAEKAFSNLDSDTAATETFLNPKSSYGAKMSALDAMLPKKGTIDVNGLQIGRSQGGTFFLQAGSKQVAINEKNIGRVIEIYEKARGGFYAQASR